MKTLPDIHPGEILLEEFLLPMNVSQNALARATAAHQ
jgi:antitoxin HigA-1